MMDMNEWSVNRTLGSGTKATRAAAGHLRSTTEGRDVMKGANGKPGYTGWQLDFTDHTGAGSKSKNVECEN